jgi:hypothetical protein
VMGDGLQRGHHIRCDLSVQIDRISNNQLWHVYHLAPIISPPAYNVQDSKKIFMEAI